MKRVQEPSLLAYCYLENKGELTARKEAVLNAVKDHPGLTAYEISIKIFHHTDPNYVRPRLTELFYQDGLVLRGEKKVCSISKRRVYTWYLA